LTKVATRPDKKKPFVPKQVRGGWERTSKWEGREGGVGVV